MSEVRLVAPVEADGKLRLITTGELASIIEAMRMAESGER